MLLFSFLANSCSKGASSSGANSADNAFPTGWTKSVPDDYLRAAGNVGSVERLDYEAKEHMNGGTVRKEAFVYLPHGYGDNPERRYDILYLMHGWGGHAGEYFDIEGGSIKAMLDNMMEKGDMAQAIVVSPSFYHSGSSREFGDSVKALRDFHREFLEELMPAVEGKYRTYAVTPTKEAFAASRDHRAFGGFSLGSVTTWFEFCHNADYIRYFLPMSGSCWYYGGYGDYHPQETCDLFERIIREKKLDSRGYFIYAATGTQDAVRDQVDIQMTEMLKRRKAFPRENVVYFMKEGGWHDFKAVREYLYNALPLFFGHRGNTDMAESNTFTAKTTIREVTEAPAFAGFGRLLLPANRSFWSGETIGDLHLTWYSGIRPEKTVEIVNTLHARAVAGQTVFLDLYTESEKNADPRKRDTGLFFFKGRPGARFALCCAGGGFAYVGAMHDSFPHALELSKKGYNAFAVIYRPGADNAMEDMARAVSLIFAHALELEVSTDCYSVWGGSAGARMAAWMGSYGPAEFGGDRLPRPGTVIMQYTGLSECTRNDPPTFAVCGTSDGIADWRVMKRRIDRLNSFGISVEFHSYDNLPHGFGLGTGTIAEGWLDKAVAFWERQMNK